MVVGPRNVSCVLLRDILRKLWTKSQLVDSVLEGVLNRALPVILEIVNVHVTVAETSARSKMEVSNHLVDTQATLDTAPLLSLLVQLLSIMLS